MFENRSKAGQQLAQKLGAYKNKADVVVLALPRGGVPVAHEVACALGAPLDVFVVRKLGAPAHPELAIGAIASGGAYYLNHELMAHLSVSDFDLEKVLERESKELRRRESLYRDGRAPLELRDRHVILVDDGLATGASMLAAVQAIKTLGPRAITAAVPVVSRSSIPLVRAEADELVYVLAPIDFRAVGEWYEDFRQTTDEEVQALLAEGPLPL